VGADVKVAARGLACGGRLEQARHRARTSGDGVEADLAMKERALARLQEADTKLRRYHAPDSLLEFLKTL
jgi:hypothetical protein